ncbi:hypothetical protein Tco_1291402 [Tanacetum coccineum]
MITQPTNIPSGNNTEVLGSILVPDVTQSHISNQASTKAIVAKHSAASASECLFADFLFEIEPKKVSEALKHPGWIDACKKN